MFWLERWLRRKWKHYLMRDACRRVGTSYTYEKWFVDECIERERPYWVKNDEQSQSW